MTFFAGESSCYKRAHDVESQFHSNDARAETEDVAVVVLPRLVRGIRVAAKRRANAAKFIRRDCCANTAPANEYADLGVALLHCFAELFCVVRIIVRNRTVVRAEVDQFVSAVAQFLNDALVQRITCMICGDGDAQVAPPLHARYNKARACFSTLSTLKPSSRNAISPGAEAPKRSRHTTSPSLPT